MASGFREIFACGIRNLGKFSLWNENPGPGILGFGIRNTAQGVRKKSSAKKDLVEYGMWENFLCGIRNTGSGILGFGIRNRAQGIRNKN